MLGEDDGYRVGIIMREGLTCEGKGCHYKGKARKAQFPRPVQISITVSIPSLHINSMPRLCQTRLGPRVRTDTRFRVVWRLVRLALQGEFVSTLVEDF